MSVKLDFLLAARGPEVPGDEPFDAAVDSDTAPLCWQARLCQSLDVRYRAPTGELIDCDDTHLPVGLALPFEDLDSTAQDPSTASCVRADPVSLVPDRDTAVLMPPESLLLSGAEIGSIVTDLNAFLQEDGLRVVAPDANRWYLCGDGLPDMPRPPAAQRAYSHIGPDATADGEAQVRKRMKTLSAEIEMYLYTHPVNEQRRAQGKPTVSGLYVWGVHGSLAAQNAQRRIVLVGNDPWLHCVAEVAGVQVLDLDGFDSLCAAAHIDAGDSSSVHICVVETAERAARLAGDEQAAWDARHTFEARWLTPATEALEQQVLTELNCAHDDGQINRVLPRTRPSLLTRLRRWVSR